MADKASTELILEQRAKGGAPAQGVWHPDFKAVKAAAVQTGRPMVAMWINPGCGFCQRFCTAATSERFVRWMKDSVAYFWLGSRTDGDAANEGREFVFKQSEDPAIKNGQRMFFPGVAVWQCKAGSPDKVLHDYRASGRVFEQEKGGDEGITNVITRIQEALQEPPHGAWVPPPKPTLKDMLPKILTADGPSKKLVALRQESGDPVPGVWHRNFNAVKNTADAKGRPFVAMWTNGDLCGYCRRFTENILDPKFQAWMKGSGAYFWLGGSMDEENQRAGDGWKFCMDSGIVGRFPFVCVQQRVGGVVTHQFFGAGADFDGGKRGADGVDSVIAKMTEVLSAPPQNLAAVKAERAKAREKAVQAQQAAGQAAPAGGCPGHADGGCPGGHPHLKALLQIGEILRPFLPKPEVKAEILPLVRFKEDLPADKRLRIVQAIADNGGHCPCKKDATPDTACLCREFRETGTCACGLFERYGK